MAEFCYDCFIKLFDENVKKEELVISTELDFCEGCGQCKRVVMRYKKPYEIFISKLGRKKK